MPRQTVTVEQLVKEAGLPWRADLAGAYSRILSKDGHEVTSTDYETGLGLDEAKALLIVTAVNSFGIAIKLSEDLQLECRRHHQAFRGNDGKCKLPFCNQSQEFLTTVHASLERK